MLSNSTTRALEQLAALADSVHEIRLRRDARRMGVSYVTRTAMESRQITLTNAKPWAKLPAKTRKMFDRSVANTCPKHQALSADERKQLARYLGFGS